MKYLDMEYGKGYLPKRFRKIGTHLPEPFQQKNKFSAFVPVKKGYFVPELI